MANTKGPMNMQGLTGEILDQTAAPYENGDFELSGGTVHAGSYIDAVGKKRVTAVYPAADMRRVAALVWTQGMRPSDIYRIALSQYLERKLSAV